MAYANFSFHLSERCLASGAYTQGNLLLQEGFAPETVDFSELNYISFPITTVLTNPSAIL